MVEYLVRIKKYYLLGIHFLAVVLLLGVIYTEIQLLNKSKQINGLNTQIAKLHEQCGVCPFVFLNCKNLYQKKIFVLLEKMYYNYYLYYLERNLIRA